MSPVWVDVYKFLEGETMTNKIKDIAGIHYFVDGDADYINLWGTDNKKQIVFAIKVSEFLSVLEDHISDDAAKDAIDSEYDDSIGLIGLVEAARREFRKHIENVYNFPNKATTNLAVANIIFEYVLLYVKENYGIDLIKKRTFNKDNALEEVKVLEYAADKSLHECRNGLAYYNHQGNHFRVFRSFDDGQKYLEAIDDEDLVIAEFESDEHLDEFLLNSGKCANCGYIGELSYDSNTVDTVVCEGCSREVAEDDLSDVMEMNICNRCEHGEEEILTTESFIKILEQADLILIDGIYLHTWNLSGDENLLIDTSWTDNDLEFECNIAKDDITSIEKKENGYEVKRLDESIEKISLIRTSFL